MSSETVKTSAVKYAHVITLEGDDYTNFVQSVCDTVGDGWIGSEEWVNAATEAITAYDPPEAVSDEVFDDGRNLDETV